MNTKKMIIFGVLAVLGAAVGVALPKMLSLGEAKAAPTDGKVAEGGHGEAPAASGDAHAAPAEGGHGEAAPGAPAAEKDPLAEQGFVVFERMVLNLHDPSLQKYLTVECVLRVDPPDQPMVKKQVAKKEPLLKDKLVTLIADKTLDDVSGKVGINRLKREIQDEFNRILFPDGVRRIQDVLFDEWHIE